MATNEVPKVAPIHWYVDKGSNYDPQSGEAKYYYGCDGPSLLASNWRDNEIESEGSGETGRIGYFTCTDPVGPEGQPQDHFFMIVKESENQWNLVSVDNQSGLELKATTADNIDELGDLVIDPSTTIRYPETIEMANDGEKHIRIQVADPNAEVLEISGISVFSSFGDMDAVIQSEYTQSMEAERLMRSPVPGEQRRLLTGFRFAASVGAVIDDGRYNKMEEPPPLSILGEPIQLTNNGDGEVTSGYGLYVRIRTNPLALAHPAAGFLTVGGEFLYAGTPDIPESACVGSNDCGINEVQGAFLAGVRFDADYFRAVSDDGVPVTEPERVSGWNLGIFAEGVFGGRHDWGRVNQDGSSLPRRLNISNPLLGIRAGADFSIDNLFDFVNVTFGAWYTYVPGEQHYNSE